MCTRKDSESEWLAKHKPETNPTTIKRETASHKAEKFSWVSLPYCSPPGCPFPIKSLALSAHASPQKIHFWVLDKSPIWALGRIPLPATFSWDANLLEETYMKDTWMANMSKLWFSHLAPWLKIISKMIMSHVDFAFLIPSWSPSQKGSTLKHSWGLMIWK